MNMKARVKELCDPQSVYVDNNLDINRQTCSKPRSNADHYFTLINPWKHSIHNYLYFRERKRRSV